MAKKILVVDDEATIVKGIKYSLEQDDMSVDCAYDGKEALELAKKNEYDMIILDVMLPEISGLDVCQQIRGFSDVPIIMLTAKDDDMDKVLGFDYGADDYLTKPFNILELKARIKAISKRYNAQSVATNSTIITKGDLVVDVNNRQVRIRNKNIELTGKEFDILELLITSEPRIISRDDLVSHIWGDDYDREGRTVDVHVSRLRDKLQKEGDGKKYIHTKWGLGYFFSIQD